jgi:hypothetical protein
MIHCYVCVFTCSDIMQHTLTVSYYVPHYFMHGGLIWLPANVQIRVCIYIGHVTYNIALTVHSPIYVITTQA